MNAVVSDTTATTPINPNFDKNVDVKEFKFRFKKDKLGNQRPNVEIKAGVPSVEGIIAIIEKGGKGLELLQDALYDVVRSAISADVGEDEKANQATIDSATYTIKVKGPDGKEVEQTFPKYSWDGIANQPREDRRASSIPDDQWEAFAKSYIETMPGVTGKSVEAVTNATIVFLKKFSMVKTNKEVISKLKEQLGLYMASAKDAEQYQEILDLLMRKADGYLGANDVELLVQNL